jgi:hypothetical protein
MSNSAKQNVRNSIIIDYNLAKVVRWLAGVLVMVCIFINFCVLNASSYALADTIDSGNDTVLINTIDDLERVRDLVNSGNNALARSIWGKNTKHTDHDVHVKLMKDLNFNDSSHASTISEAIKIITCLANEINDNLYGWKPIGTSASPFNGTFDGNGFAIRNLYICRPAYDEMYGYAGFFGFTEGATIKNVTLKNMKLLYNTIVREQDLFVGSLVGLTSNTTIINAQVDGEVDVKITSNYFTYYSVGGLAGMADLIDNSRSSANVAVEVMNNNFTHSAVGGLVGSASNLRYYSNTHHIKDSSASGNVSNKLGSTGTAISGGLVGDLCTNITNSLASGNVSSTSLTRSGTTIAAGLVGGYGTMYTCIRPISVINSNAFNQEVSVYGGDGVEFIRRIMVDHHQAHKTEVTFEENTALATMRLI